MQIYRLYTVLYIILYIYMKGNTIAHFPRRLVTFLAFCERAQNIYSISWLRQKTALMQINENSRRNATSRRMPTAKFHRKTV